VFDSHSFPADSMDEHVAIGGRYFDLHDTTSICTACLVDTLDLK